MDALRFLWQFVTTRPSVSSSSSHTNAISFTKCTSIPIILSNRRNGDNCLHVAAAYNSLECMILLSNFGGMELFMDKNRYGLRAIEIAQKMRNYECFEVLQKLERNV